MCALHSQNTITHQNISYSTSAQHFYCSDLWALWAVYVLKKKKKMKEQKIEKQQRAFDELSTRFQYYFLYRYLPTEKKENIFKKKKKKNEYR